MTIEINTTPFDVLQQSVQSSGNPTTAKYILVGDAPGWQEMKDGTPFLGPSGQALNRCLAGANILKSECYITYVCQTKLPNNNIEVLASIKGYRHPDWAVLIHRLKMEIAQCPNACVIIPMGVTALMAVCPELTPYISRHRGSPTRYKHPVTGHDLVCVPTWHPSMCLPDKDPSSVYVITADLFKAAKLADTGIPKPHDAYYIRPTYDHACQYLAHILETKNPTSFDIECTTASGLVTAISFTHDEHTVMSIPFRGPEGRYFTPEQEVEIWRLISAILYDVQIKKIAFNGMFDITYLLRIYGIVTRNFWYDPMVAHHLCYADLRKGLDFCISFYLTAPYYKEDGKLWKSPFGHDYEKFWMYNAKDALYTHQLVAPTWAEIQRIHAEHVFTHLMALHPPLIEMQSRGIRLDVGNKELGRTKINAEVTALKTELLKLTKVELNINSSKQLKQYFYTDKGIKPYVNRKTGADSCDVKALERLAAKGYPEALIIVEIRKRLKLLSTYYDATYDSDGRMRCSYNICGTESGRLSSSSTIFDTGMNLQNQPPSFKQYYVADPNMLLCEVDLSQAEARVVAYLCEDPVMIAGFESGQDVHTYNASVIFGVPYDQVQKEQRQMAKRIVHASNYMMGPGTFALNCNIPISEARKLLDVYNRRYVKLSVWQQSIAQTVQRTRMLYSILGRPKRFLGFMDQDLVRSAVSFIPQSTVAHGLNMQTIHLYNDHRFHELELMATVHDSDLVQFPDDTCDNMYQRLCDMRDVITLHLEVNGRKFTIPCDFKVGYNWYDMHEIKTLTKEACSNVWEKLHNAVS